MSGDDLAIWLGIAVLALLLGYVIRKKQLRRREEKRLTAEMNQEEG